MIDEARMIELLSDTPYERERREQGLSGKDRSAEWKERNEVTRVLTVPDGDWELLVARAAEKDERSKKENWTREWSSDYNLLGCIGEWAYGQISGLPVKTGFGDGGTDFPGVDVKASAYWDDPFLRLPVKESLRARFYALVAVDLPGRRARYLGYATQKMIFEADRRDFGYGPNWMLRPSQLVAALP